MSESPNPSPEYDNPDISIETARLEDAAEIIAMKNQVWMDTYPDPDAGITEEAIRLRLEGENGERISRAVEHWQHMIANAGESQAVFIARKQGKIVGVVAPGFIDGQRRLGALYVLPGQQGQGLGTKLLKKAIAWHGRNEDIFLHAASHNQSAIDFYEKNGFERTGKVINDSLMPEVEMILPGLLN